MIDGNEDNAKAVKWLLRNFEVLSGLAVNFEKCNVCEVNVEREELDRVVGILGCRVGEFPIPYVGLKV